MAPLVAVVASMQGSVIFEFVRVSSAQRKVEAAAASDRIGPFACQDTLDHGRDPSDVLFARHWHCLDVRKTLCGGNHPLSSAAEDPEAKRYL